MIDFKNTKTKEDIIGICSANYLDLEKYCKVGIMEAGFIYYKNLDEEKEQKLIEIAHLSDKECKDKTYTDMDVDVRKLNTVMTSTVLLDNYYDSIKNLTTEELIILSNFMSMTELYLFDETLKIYNKDIIDAVNKKGETFFDKEVLLTVAHKMIEEGKVFPSELKKYIQETPVQEVHKILADEIFDALHQAMK
ncbi:MAG: hypothetical protein IJF92_01385 [Bacilli bacterium]|nr:hypothetical protein [Bacilli bacterium]